MRRHIIGFFAILLLIGSGLYLIYPEYGETTPLLKAACFRMAPVLILLWLAYPELERMPWWIWIIVPGTLVVLAWRPRLIPIALPLLILFGILRPRKAKNLQQSNSGSQ